MTNDLTGWSTTAERIFIETMAAKPEGIGLLRGYLAGMKRRVDFGKIDAKHCIEYAEFRLQKLLKPTRAEEFDLAN
jgi:hypothetical protein